MTIEFEYARDEINTQFLEAWDANSTAVAGYIPEIRWQGIQYRSMPDGSKFWCRVSKQTVIEEQTTLSNDTSAQGKKRFTASGVVFIQIFCPKSNTQAYRIGQLLAKIARDAFRGKKTPGGIWFRNARVQEIGPEELYERFNVVAEFEYDEIG